MLEYVQKQRLSIDYLPTHQLNPRSNNPRTHSKKQIAQIANAIRRFGFTNPILVDDNGGIIAGHGRLEAAKQIGLSEVPTVRLSQMSEAEIRAYVIADNKLAENAGWDRKLLALEFRYLSDLDIDLDLTLTGFELPDIDILIGELSSASIDDGADTIIEPSGPAVTRAGDIWQIGAHRLICGDSTKRETYQALLRGESAQMVFTDPPYNVPILGHVGGLGKVQHREFAMASGEMSEAEFTAFLNSVFVHLAAFATDGAIHFICMDWRHLREVSAAAATAYTELKNLCVWAKNNGGMGSLYRSQHELIFVFKSGTSSHVNNVELGKHGRYRTNVWSYAGVNSFGGDRSDLELHPTVKPVSLVADAIRDCSHRKGIILDAFVGSGTTLLAAEQTGRQGYGIEIDPLYCDVTLQRLQLIHGLQATLEGTGENFAEASEARGRQSPQE
ncbi:site-specific DNA-methyltransferase [Bradyrhizobium elkanii]|jgi:DNA modification methylase|uniref:site-specific DNA-methyltransferase n=1 Tax=Bradyrhizobium elkanii TaxID=29448 RepID=UPI0004852413|nr:DNA methyltransferase [Bradyrhizobium elkanii]MCP1927436.1 DNA modification methylase [Bradyrhizobium elkanii]MCS3475048.1 DNA modification methylase [Bradyrhizobium elkanii]MCS3521052.1 DNA modification methylase [Bradyrhizobium elkanii]MCS4068707.1 DNA modification methylase [Bradyrhizobium elkanii]MCS4084241.1 DNA modification methylase [Bradyrhizobium elkanii]